ncbi:hypothetical protein [Mycoplasmopsis glycophila]|uniref:Uncharacterized protein n=1 Tax=Mycoplasmopsis glycophila TaxID=171285 RepID=A0A449AVF9_9BACT|nr:hypothetical protein [Mycoplasmopsis glycophila]VEU70529.1 Uncharacterised protein [Mycoplasmopsis glycophila]
MIKNNQKIYKATILLLLIILGLFNILISSNIIRINLFNLPVLDAKIGFVLPYYARIISCFIYTLIIFACGSFLVYKNKLSSFFFQNLIFILGIFITFAWIPVTIIEKDPETSKQITSSWNWLWYKGDVAIVFAFYAIFYFVSIPLSNKLRRQSDSLI